MKNILTAFKISKEPHLAALLGKLYKHGVTDKIPVSPSKSHAWYSIALNLETQDCDCILKK